MKSLSELSVKLVVILAFTVVTSVRSEYTWNGSEWVWSESSDTKSEEVQGSNNEWEGSGGGGYGDDVDDNFDDEYNIEEEGSGDNSVDDSYNTNTGNNYNSNTNYNNNYNQENSYNINNRGNQGSVPGSNNPGYQDPYDPYSNQGSQNNNFGQNNNIDYAPTTKTPFYNQDNSGGDDIYVDPPVNIPQTTSTTTETPRDPSIRPKNPSRPTSFFAQPGTLAAVIGGAVVGLLCAILCVMFVVYRMRKKDEGSYALDEPKRSPTVNAYAKHPSREFYA